jgi:anti-sigma B factor antagonist
MEFAMEDLSISVEKIGDIVDLVKLTGNLDAHTFESFEEVIDKLLGEGRYRIIVDMAGVVYVSSAGVGIFIAAANEVEENDGMMVLLSPSEAVLDVFDLLGLTETFEIAEGREEALERVVEATE